MKMCEEEAIFVEFFLQLMWSSNRTLPLSFHPILISSYWFVVYLLCFFSVCLPLFQAPFYGQAVLCYI